MEKIDWQEITEELGEDRWRDDLVVMPRQSRLLLAKLVQENRFLSRDPQQIYYGPDSQAELYDAAKTAYNSLTSPIQSEFIDMFINGDLVVNNDDLVVDTSEGTVKIGTTATPYFAANLYVVGSVSPAIFQNDSGSIGTSNQFYNADTTDANRIRLAFTTDTTGADETIGRALAQIDVAFDAHLHSAQYARIIFNTSSNSTSPAARMQIGAGIQVGIPAGGDKGAGTINLPTAYYVNGLPVIGVRKTGWSSPTGTASRATFNTSTVTLESLAQRFKGLMDDLMAHGLIGA